MQQDFTPERDASLGLVFRLNFLWSQTDYAALEGNYDKWNNILDRIYCNLLYKEEIEVEEEGGNIIKVKLSTKDVEVYAFLSRNIHSIKRKFMKALKKDKSLMRSRWYHSVQKKDIWLRKLMQTLKLYLKENIKTPGRAMFGEFGRKGGY